MATWPEAQPFPGPLASGIPFPTLPELGGEVEVHRFAEQGLLGFGIAPGLSGRETLLERGNQGGPAGVTLRGAGFSHGT